MKDNTIYLEIARIGMAMVASEICDELGITDDEFVRLRDNLIEKLNSKSKKPTPKTLVEVFAEEDLKNSI